MAAKSEAPRDPVRRWTLIILAAIVALYLYSIIADRMTPYTSQATVQAFIVRMAPEVSGRVQEVPVSDNQKVKAGDILFRIDPQTYEIALKQADARLASVGQTIGANTAAVAAAQERLIEAQAKREHVIEQSNRTLELVKKGVYSEARKDLVLKEIDVAEASVREATRSWSARVRNSAHRETTIRNFAKRSRQSSKPSSILSERRLSLPPTASSPICSLPTASMLTPVRPL